MPDLAQSEYEEGGEAAKEEEAVDIDDVKEVLVDMEDAK